MSACVRKNSILLLVVTLFLLFCTSASQARNLPDFTELVEEAAPAVVNISTTQTSRQRSNINTLPPDMPDIFRHFFRDFPGYSEPAPRQRQSLGSGFIISEDGYVLTNNHVVEGADEIIVRLSDRRELVAELIGSDAATDVALLKIDAEGLPVVRIGDSESLKVGEWVLAIGSPFGFDHSVTAGIVSAKGRALPNETYVPFIQTDVAINPGNSGGPLFNLDGEVVGINSQIYTRSGGFMGLSFAIPVQVALDVADQLRDSGQVSRGWLGVVIQNVNRDLAESFGLDRPRGALIASVDPEGPAARGGIQSGDIILAVNDRLIETSSDLPPAVGRLRPGEEGLFQVLRDGEEIELRFAVGERPADGQLGKADTGTSPADAAEVARVGVSVEAVPAVAAQRLGIAGGVRVVQVHSGSPAELAGIRAGDVLVSIHNEQIADPAHFRALVQKLNAGQPVPLRLMRQGNSLFVALTLTE